MGSVAAHSPVASRPLDLRVACVAARSRSRSAVCAVVLLFLAVAGTDRLLRRRHAGRRCRGRRRRPQGRGRRLRRDLRARHAARDRTAARDDRRPRGRRRSIDARARRRRDRRPCRPRGTRAAAGTRSSRRSARCCAASAPTRYPCRSPTARPASRASSTAGSAKPRPAASRATCSSTGTRSIEVEPQRRHRPPPRRGRAPPRRRAAHDPDRDARRRCPSARSSRRSCRRKSLARPRHARASCSPGPTSSSRTAATLTITPEQLATALGTRIDGRAARAHDRPRQAARRARRPALAALEQRAGRRVVRGHCGEHRRSRAVGRTGARSTWPRSATRSSPATGSVTAPVVEVVPARDTAWAAGRSASRNRSRRSRLVTTPARSG